jgi:hypothetical protein
MDAVLVRAAEWLADNPRPAVALALALAVAVTVVLANLTWVYFITDKKGEAVRVGIAYFGGLHKRHVAYRKGRDGSTKKGDPWHRRVRWWMPMVPYRLARWAGRKGVSHTGEWPGWLRGGRTVVLHLTRKRAKRRESAVIVSVQPRHNYQENPLHQKRPRRQKVVA